MRENGEMFERFKVPTVRDAFGEALCEIAEKDKRIVLISGDSQGASKTTRCASRFPERSFNLGIAEQNMVAFAAGMALEGYIPFVSTRAPFLSMRAAEQIRTAVCYDNLPVRFIGTGAGVCSGCAGATHWSLEDVAILSSFGNMTVFETGDRNMIRNILHKSLDWNHPMYVRLGKDTEETLYDEDVSVPLGKSVKLLEGRDGYFLVSGTVVSHALKAAQALSKNEGLSIGVCDMFSLKPIDRERIIDVAKSGHVVIAEDHARIGGLGNLIQTILIESKMTCQCIVKGYPDTIMVPASADYIYNQCELDDAGLIQAMIECMK